MRTTLNIDDEVLHAARELARQENSSTGEVVSRLLRRALTGERAETREQAADYGTVAGFRPFANRHSVVDDERIDRLRDEEGV